MNIKKFYLVIFMSMLIFTLSACSEEPISTDTQELPEDTVASSKTEENTGDTTTADSQIISAKIHATSLENNMIEEDIEREISIYLPAGYASSDKRYPVIYYLPGFETRDFIYLSHIGATLEEYDIDNIIAVAISGFNKIGGSFYTNSPAIGNWEDFITKDVIDYIDSNYRTIATSAGRGLAGHSMGGYGSISIAFNNPGLFDYVYSMSPGLFDKDGLSQSPVEFDRIMQYEDMDDEAAKTEYRSYMDNPSWSYNFSLAYASAFAYDVDAKAPYVKLPAKNAQGEYLQDEIWDLYEAGYGNLSERLDTQGENLKLLKKFAIEYGIHDNYTWIPKGCDYFSTLLNEHDIPHELIPFDGGHNDQLNKRIEECMIPFFSEAFQNLEN